jgi:hypothetical protein
LYWFSLVLVVAAAAVLDAFRGEKATLRPG